MQLKPPTGLGTKAKKLWADLTGVYEFRADELRTLEDCCREVDLIERLEKELKEAALVVRGSQGQPVSHPHVTEIRQHRATLNRLLGSLKLPDEGGADSGSDAGRALAAARWGQRGA